MNDLPTQTAAPAIKEKARARGLERKLPYAGALLPAEAHELLKSGARLVDVRTKPEVLYVGRVPGSVFIEWQTYPGNVANPDFLAQLRETVEPGETLMFLCRSGHRSHDAAAAAAEAGWVDAYNVLEGFEGPKDPQQHRGELGGWRKAGLPWVQG
jgi:rhodanese-related sulfurtransferase